MLENIRFPCVAALLGSVAPAVWAVGLLAGDHVGRGGPIDKVAYFFPFSLLMLLAPAAGNVLTIFIFFAASICNIILYFVVALIIRSIANYIVGLL